MNLKIDLISRSADLFNILEAAQGPAVAEKFWTKFETLVEYGIGGDKEHEIAEARAAVMAMKGVS